MGDRKERRIVIAIVIACIATYVLGIRESTRWTYPICHGGIIHLMVNLWCLMTIVTSIRRDATDLAVSMLIAFLVYQEGCVGLSGFVFALLGSCIMRVGNKGTFLLYTFLFIALGMLFSNIAVQVHLYAFILGCIYGMARYRIGK